MKPHEIFIITTCPKCKSDRVSYWQSCMRKELDPSMPFVLRIGFNCHDCGERDETSLLTYDLSEIDLEMRNFFSSHDLSE